MAITTADIKSYLSGGAANTDPNASIGGAISTTEWLGGTLHDLFDVITGDENAASDVEYRCVYVKNTHATLTLLGTKLWIVSQVAGGADAALGLGAASNAAASATPTAATIADENTVPASVTFSAPTSKAAGLSIGDIGPGQAFPIWIRRTAANTAAVDNDGLTFSVEGDTSA